MMQTLTWIFAGGVAAAYVWSRRETKPTIGAPSAQREADVTRWRHDGSQPIGPSWWEGTVMNFKSSYAQQLDSLRKSLD